MTVDADPARRGRGSVDPTVGRAAYRVVQEALTNAGKHAPGGAVRVTVDLRAERRRGAVVNRRGHPAGDGAAQRRATGWSGWASGCVPWAAGCRAEPRLDGGFGVEAVLPA